MDELATHDLPDLPPEVKIHMKLDDIIKFTRCQAAVSHNLQLGKKKNRRRPFTKRRYKSQNWRLRQNGPNTPRYRYPWRSRFQRSRVGKIRAFLERKYRTSPMHSVFHRLGWNPAQMAAQSKLHRAIYYRRPQMRNFPFRSNFYRKPQVPNDPNRYKKMLASAIHYNKFNGLQNVIDSQSLNEMNLQQLNEAVGGHITSIKENKLSDNVSEVTITRINNPINLNGVTYNDMAPTNSVFSSGYTTSCFDPMSGNRTSSVFSQRAMQTARGVVMNQQPYIPPLTNGDANTSPLLRDRSGNIPSDVANISPLLRNNSMTGVANVPPLIRNVQPQMNNSYANMPPLVMNVPGNVPASANGPFSNLNTLAFASQQMNRQGNVPASANGPFSNLNTLAFTSQQMNLPGNVPASANGLSPNMNTSLAFASQQRSNGIDAPLSIHATNVPFHNRFSILDKQQEHQEQARMEF